MIVTASNQLIGVTPTILTDAGIDEVPANITDPDHSLTYTSGSAVDDFTISFGALNGVSYVAISGQDAAAINPATVEVLNSGVLVQQVTISRNHNLVFSFETANFTDLQVKFLATPNTTPVTVSYIAAGIHLEVPRGEQSGYSRNWLKRHLTQQTSSNFEVGPTATTQKRKALKGVLSSPNQELTFIESEWQPFIDFTFEQPFFIKEIDDRPESSYLCYNGIHDTKAHSETRLLDNLSLSFTAYNGL
jgi:hypothetical protein